MKKYSKILLVLLAVALIASTVFATLSSAATTSPYEQEILNKAAALGITRKVEDFTGEEILVWENVVPDEPYAEKSEKNTTKDKWVQMNGSSKYGAVMTADSKSGNRYVKLVYDKAYASEDAVQSSIYFNDKQAFKENSYLVYEWDMTTETQYPADLSVMFQNSNASTIGDSVDIFTIDAETRKLVVGDNSYDLGLAGTWHHITVVIKLVANGTDYTGSLGLLFLDGEKIGEFTPVENNKRKNALRIAMGYFKQAKNETLDNTTLCVDNFVSSTVEKSYAGSPMDNLQKLFNADAPLTDLATFGSNEIVYSGAYELPYEPAAAVKMNDGTYFFTADFAQAYEKYKEGNAQFVELYDSDSGAIDTAVVLALFPGVTFSDTTEDTDAGKFPCVEAKKGDITYYTYTKETKTLALEFYNVCKEKEPEAAPVQSTTAAVGTIPVVIEGITAVDFYANEENPDFAYQPNGLYDIYLNGEKCEEFPLVTEALVASGENVISVYPQYELVQLAFEFTSKNAAGEVFTQYFFDKTEFFDFLEIAPTGATFTLRTDMEVVRKLELKGSKLSIDLAGHVLHQGEVKAIVPFVLGDNTSLYLYSSRPGGEIYCGYAAGTEIGNAAMIQVKNGENVSVHLGYADEENKDAYLNNMTVHASTVAKLSAASTTIDAYGVNFKVVGTTALNRGLFEITGANCKNTSISLTNVTVYNTENQNNILYFNAPGKNNTIAIKDTVIYTADDTKELVALGGALTNADTQTITLEDVTYYGKLAGVQQDEENTLKVQVLDNVVAGSYDETTLALAQNVKPVHNNKCETLEISYVQDGVYKNTKLQRSVTLPALQVLMTSEPLENFCEVEWTFNAEIESVKEFWVKGVTPEFRGEYPVSSELITFKHLPESIPTIAETDTKITIAAVEDATLELLMLSHNVSLAYGMKYNIYIPVAAPLVSVTVGEKVILVSDIEKTDEYYIAQIDTFTLKDLASAKYTFSINLKTKADNEFALESEVVVLDYFAALYENEEVEDADKTLVTSFLKYAFAAINYFEYDGAEKIAELIAGKNANYYLIDSMAETNNIRAALKGVRLNLVEIPEFVFYLRDAFNGTVTIAGKEYTVANGKCDGALYIAYRPADYATFADKFTISIVGTIGETEINESGEFSLTNYLYGVREQLGSTPSYVLALYQFCKEATSYVSIPSIDDEIPEY